MSNENNDPNKFDPSKFEDLFKKIEEKLARLERLAKEKKSENTNEKKNNMIWFSMDSNLDFVNSKPLDWENENTASNNNEQNDKFDWQKMVDSSGSPQNFLEAFMKSLPPMPMPKMGNQGKVSPDLANFMVEAGMLLYDALYMPFASRKGRLTEFFSWVEKARDRMEQEDFTKNDRSAFTEWCRSVGDTLLQAQDKHGLWLTDDEEDLVVAMNTNIFQDTDIGENDSLGGEQ